MPPPASGRDRRRAHRAAPARRAATGCTARARARAAVRGSRKAPALATLIVLHAATLVSVAVKRNYRGFTSALALALPRQLEPPPTISRLPLDAPTHIVAGPRQVRRSAEAVARLGRNHGGLRARAAEERIDDGNAARIRARWPRPCRPPQRSAVPSVHRHGRDAGRGRARGAGPQGHPHGGGPARHAGATAALAAVARALERETLGYTVALGLPALRERIARLLSPSATASPWRPSGWW